MKRILLPLLMFLWFMLPSGSLINLNNIYQIECKKNILKFYPCIGLNLIDIIPIEYKCKDNEMALKLKNEIDETIKNNKCNF
jgi:hypothetical protein